MLWIPYLFIGISSTLLNGAIIYTFYKKRALLKRPPNYLICNFAGADIFTGFILTPTYIIELLCKLTTLVSSYLMVFSVFVWVFSLFLLTLERNIAMIRPSMHSRVMRLLSTQNIVIFCWISPTIITVLPLIWEFQSQEEKQIPADISNVIMWVILCLFLIMILAMYGEMFAGLGRSIVNQRAKKRKTKMSVQQAVEGRVLILLTLLLLVFLLAFVPFMYLYYGTLERRQLVLKTRLLITLSLWTFLIHLIFDPLIVVYTKKDIREAVRQVMPYPCNNAGIRIHDVNEIVLHTTFTQAPKSPPEISVFTTQIH